MLMEFVLDFCFPLYHISDYSLFFPFNIFFNCRNSYKSNIKKRNHINKSWQKKLNPKK